MGLSATAACSGGATIVAMVIGPACPLPAIAGQLAPALAAILGSEDLLFRDPFAEFIPSGR